MIENFLIKQYYILILEIKRSPSHKVNLLKSQISSP